MSSSNDVIISPISVPQSTIVVRSELLAEVRALVTRLEQAPPITDATSMEQIRAIMVAANQLLKKVEEQRKAAQKPFDHVVQLIRSAAKPVTEQLEAVVQECKMQLSEALEEQARRNREAEAQRLQALQNNQPAVIPLPAVEKPPVVTQTRKEVVVIDPDKVPKEYWVLDMFRIRADALSGIVIPGVEVRETQIVVAR